MRVYYGQISPIVGDIVGNAQKILDAVKQAAGNYDVFLFPELALLGYPPMDLLLRPDFLRDVVTHEFQLVRDLQDIMTEDQTVIYGTVKEDYYGNGLLNSASIVTKHSHTWRHKTLLPTYDVFDERRWFIPARDNALIPMGNGNWGCVLICEDVWDDKRSLGYDTTGPLTEIINGNCVKVTHLFVLNASPWYMGKNKVREQLISNIAKKHKLEVHYVNQVGGNDSLIFDGGSFRCDNQGNIVFRSPLFQVDISASDGPGVSESTNPIQELNDALVLGVRDYMRKTGFTKAVIASSGGIDSAVVVSIAEEALGAENVHTIAMPGPYSSDRSAKLAERLASNLGVGFEVVDIKPMYEAVTASTGHFSKGVANENVQARLRGMVVMKYSNSTGAMVLTTGNKSEVAVGYCTLYGDMCGGLAVIADVPKMMVYELARFINKHDGEVIPQEIIDRAPSAELAPDQKDSDSLPPYPILDAIIRCYVDEEKSIDQFDPEIPREIIPGIIRKIEQNEYKRQQAAPTLKVTSKAFGMGRKRLISAKYTPR